MCVRAWLHHILYVPYFKDWNFLSTKKITCNMELAVNYRTRRDRNSCLPLHSPGFNLQTEPSVCVDTTSQFGLCSYLCQWTVRQTDKQMGTCRKGMFAGVISILCGSGGTAPSRPLLSGDTFLENKLKFHDTWTIDKRPLTAWANHGPSYNLIPCLSYNSSTDSYFSSIFSDSEGTFWYYTLRKYCK